MEDQNNKAMTYTPFHIFGEDRPGRWLVTCDHASNAVPPEVNGGNLGLSAQDMTRHIAYDPGAAGVTLALAEMLDAPALLSNFSRLVIDPNRSEDDPTVLMKLYDGTVIPANRSAGPDERERRLAAYYRPYHIAQGRMAARQDNTVLLSIHSYTKQLQGREVRPWHIGILYGQDSHLAIPLIRRLEAEPDLCVGQNQPYVGHLDGDSVDRHARTFGRANVLIEIRNDLIETSQQQYDWAKRLAPILKEVLNSTQL